MLCPSVSPVCRPLQQRAAGLLCEGAEVGETLCCVRLSVPSVGRCSQRAAGLLCEGAEVGETLCVFDPHARYVPGATAEEPGRRYDNLAELRPVFTDVFGGYLEDLFELRDATMFRFPLRTEQMAKHSQLSDQV